MADVTGQAEQRSDICAALHGLAVTVDGVDQTLTAHPTRPNTPTAYDCWPNWVAIRPVAMCVSEIDWTVLVALPGPDAQSYVAAGDDLIETVMAALDAWQLTRVEPVQILLGEAQAMPGLQFALTI